MAHSIARAITGKSEAVHRRRRMLHRNRGRRAAFGANFYADPAPQYS
jgi:hypothetical protein